jgi:hypothetical protein
VCLLRLLLWGMPFNDDQTVSTQSGFIWDFLVGSRQI